MAADRADTGRSRRGPWTDLDVSAITTRYLSRPLSVVRVSVSA
jgi:hypothetical protein